MKRLAIAAFLLMFAGLTVAEENSTWRVGASVSYADFETDDGAVNNGGAGFKAHAQFKPTDLFGIEGAYVVSPEFKGDLDTTLAGQEVEISYEGVTIHALGYLPSPSERLEFFIKGGYFSFYDVTQKIIDGSNVSSSDGSDDGLALGFGMSIDAEDNIGIRLEFDWYDTAGAQLFTIGLGGEYRF